MPDASNAPTSPPCPTCTFLALQPKDPTKKRTPRVEELLRQNHPPLELELADFRVVIDKSPEILQDLDAKIAQATETLTHLQEARRAAESHLIDAKALVHPIRSLPNEALAEIFMHTTPYWDDDEYIDSLNPKSSPWIVTHICRRWRDLAISLPQLWTFIDLDFDVHALHISPRQCAYKTGLYLGRSKDRSLSVVLTSESIITNHAVFPILELSIPRWERLSITIPEQSLQSFSGNIFSRLHMLELDHVKAGQRNGTVTTFISAPALRSAFTYDPNWEVFKKVPLPWARLTEARGLPAFDKPGLECLRKMSSLQHLQIDIGKTYDVVKDVVVLPKLQHLVLDESSEADPGRLRKFFSSLEVPALTSLTLNYPDVAERVMYLPRSIGAVAKLTTLDISCEMSNHKKNPQNLLNFLSLLSHVEEFRLRDVGVTKRFIRGLTISSTTWRLPCLRILDIQETFFSGSFPVIFDMLESRYNVVAEDEGSQSVGVARPSTTYFLEKVIVPRWLYFRNEERWKDICNALHVECGVSLSDGDTDADEGDEEDEEDENEEEEIVTEATS